MTREPTVRRGGGLSGPMAGVMAVAILGLVECAIVVVLIVLPILTGDDLPMWRIILCIVLLTLTSGVFVAASLVKEDGRWRWRWTR
jgi:hypothetical protein